MRTVEGVAGIALAAKRVALLDLKSKLTGQEQITLAGVMKLINDMLEEVK